MCVCVQPCSDCRSCLISLWGKTKFPSGAIVATAGITVGMTTGIPRCCCQRAHLVSKCQKNWCRSGTLHLCLHLSTRKWVDIFQSVHLLLSFVFCFLWSHDKWVHFGDVDCQFNTWLYFYRLTWQHAVRVRFDLSNGLWNAKNLTALVWKYWTRWPTSMSTEF